MGLFHRFDSADQVIVEYANLINTITWVEFISAIRKEVKTARQKKKAYKRFLKEHKAEIAEAVQASVNAISVTRQETLNRVKVRRLINNEEVVEYYPLYTYDIFYKAAEENYKKGMVSKEVRGNPFLRN